MNYRTTETVYGTFSTSVAGTPTTLSGTPSLSVYKNGSTTQEAESVTADFDSITGLNHFAIDLSGSAFYVADSDYSVVIASGTVGGVSVVGRVVGSFTTRVPPVDIAEVSGSTVTTTTIPTVTQIRQEMDSNSTQLAAIVEDTSTTIPAQITALDFSTLDAAQIRAAIGMAAADLDSQLSSIGASTDTLYTYTFNAPQNTRVFVYSDVNRTVLVRSGTTDATAKVTFDLPAATFYYLAINQYGQELTGSFTVVAS